MRRLLHAAEAVLIALLLAADITLICAWFMLKCMADALERKLRL
jgi:hypothetical protein